MIRASFASPAFGALTPVGGRPTRRGERALEVDLDDRVPLLLGHVHEHAVAQDAGVVDEHVEAAERLDGGVDEALGALPVGDVVAVGDGLAAHRLDLVDDVLRRAGRLTRAVHLAAEVVHHDLGPVRRQHQRVLAADAPARAGHDRDSSLTQPRHWCPPCRFGARYRCRPCLAGDGDRVPSHPVCAPPPLHTGGEGRGGVGGRTETTNVEAADGGHGGR